MVQGLGLSTCTAVAGFNPWSGNSDPMSHAVWPKKEKERVVVYEKGAVGWRR